MLVNMSRLHDRLHPSEFMIFNLACHKLTRSNCRCLVVVSLLGYFWIYPIARIDCPKVFENILLLASLGLEKVRDFTDMKSRFPEMLTVYTCILLYHIYKPNLPTERRERHFIYAKNKEAATTTTTTTTTWTSKEN